MLHCRRIINEILSTEGLMCECVSEEDEIDGEREVEEKKGRGEVDERWRKRNSQKEGVLQVQL